MAYRTADHERWNGLDFVIGIEIKLSNNHPVEDICNELCGVYPKTFKFVGWHPFCRCIAVPKLADEDEFIARQQALIDGQNAPQGGYSGEVTQMPECFNNWVKENEERIETAKSEPYFIRDNRDAVQRVLGGSEAPISKNAPKRTIKEIAEERHAARTQAQIDDIKRRYWMRWEPDGLTEAEKDANIDAYLLLERDLGIKRGRPMSFQEANELRGNPNYLKSEAYRVNCQSCVVANELRRRGFNIEALPNLKGSALEALSRHTETAWLDKDGNTPKSSFSGVRIIKKKRWDGREYEALERVAKNRKQMLKALESDITEDGRYHIKWTWARENKGHIITVERTNGVLRFYDPQNGVVIDDFVGYINGIDTKRGIRYLRVDTLRPNVAVGKNVLTKPTIKAAEGDAATIGTIGHPEFADLLKQRREALTSGRFALNAELADNPQLQTGKLLQSKKTLNRIIQHCQSKEEIDAVEYIWSHSEELRHIRVSKLGEGKDMTSPKNIKNIQGKRKRGVVRYQEYEFSYNGTMWTVKLEETKYGFEQFYFIKKK